ncbi:SusC/RagA family TonB-linked outer membrane protein [Aquimarina macrocephali]|uniref:SusC/RagA family TonB-linked outer membrane protein n=1 Tax=Aquimarina macrocephali TaxID=666563 RepID=UPI003F671573
MKCKRNNLWFSFVLLCSSVLTFAQERTITGTVTYDLVPLPGVNITIKGTGEGTQTDFDGNYTINAKTGDIIQFSYIGMQAQEKKIEPSVDIINILFQQDNNELDEIVITALGLQKKKDNDLSSSTTLDTEVIQRSGESGIIQGMAGKTSGIRITRNSGDPGSGAYIQIRGQNTILGNATPMIIIDGIPVSNASIGGGTGGVSQQSRLNDINQDDIRNVTILKGAAAAAVYGTGAANGVIVIQTKKGSGDKVSVNLKSAVTFDQINVEYNKQGKYGQGLPDTSITDYAWVPNTGFSWGDKIADRSGGLDDVTIGQERFVAESGNVYYPITQKNSREVFNTSNRDQVFQTGFTFENALSVSFSGEKSNSFLSYSDWNQQGIMRGQSTYHRQTFRLNNEFDISENITARITTNYSKIKAQRIQQGSNLNGLYLGYLRTSPDFDNRDYKGTYYDDIGLSSANAHRGYRRYLGDRAPSYNNPGWTINEQKNPNIVNRIIINPELNWKVRNNITFTARYGLDYYTDNRETFFPVNSAGAASTGFFSDRTIISKIENYNFFISSNFDLGNNFNLGWIAGVSMTDNYQKSETGTETNFTNPIVGDLLLFGNSTVENNGIARTITERKKSGAYTVINAELFDQLLFEFSGRYERPSTLNESIFYPSASIGWQFSNLISDSKFLSFGKIRASYGEVGIEPVPYSNITTFAGGGVGSGWGDGLVGALYGNPFVRNFVQGNADLKEERVKEYEVGADIRLFKNNVSLGFTYYDRTTEDVILNLTLPASTGYTNRLNNAAEISNKGFEIDLGIDIIESASVSWKIDANFSKNNNMVEDLSGVESVFLAGFAGTSSRVVEGHPIGTLWGGRYLRNTDGSLNLDANGFPQADPVNGVIGNPNPDWTGGLGTTFSWKGVTLSAQFETSQGGDMWAGTRGVLNFFGIDPDTANESVTPTGGLTSASGTVYPAGTTFRGNIQDFGAGPVALDIDWYTGTGGGFGPLAEQFVDDASWTRLRELSLYYSFPKRFFKNMGITNMEIGVTGRNLILWTDFKGVDPDLNLTGASLGRGLDYFTNPGTKSYIATVKIGF